MYKQYFLLVLMYLFVGVVQVTSAEEPFKINITLTPPLGTPERNGFLDQVVTEMLQRVGLEPSFEFLHEERGLRALNMGLDDGNLPRVKGLEEFYPDIRQVPGKVMDFHFQVFSKRPDVVVNGWDSLREYDVAFVTGWKILEQHVKSDVINKVSTSEQLFKLLDQDRTQLVIYEKWQGMELMRKLGLVDIRVVEPPLISREMYLYVNKRHEPLIPQLAQALANMKEDGSYQRIYQQTLGDFLQSGQHQ